MPTDLEVAEAEADEERSRRKPRSRAGLFALVLLVFFGLACVSAFLPGHSLDYPWFAYPEGTVIESIGHPHLRGTVYRVGKSHDQLRDDIFDRQGFSPATGLSFKMKAVMLGLRGVRSQVKIPGPSSFDWQSTLVVERYKHTTSFALMLGGTSNRVSRLLVFEHSVNPSVVFHSTTITGDVHLYPAIRGTGGTSSGATMGVKASTYDCPDSLEKVRNYYETTFAPTEAAPETTSPAMRVSSVLNATARDYTLVIQGTGGLVIIHVAEDQTTKKTHLSVVEVSP